MPGPTLPDAGGARGEACHKTGKHDMSNRVFFHPLAHIRLACVLYCIETL